VAGRRERGTLAEVLVDHAKDNGLIADAGDRWIGGHGITCRRLAGTGRWIYCKYCYKSVAPWTLEETVPETGVWRMVCCGECEAGLTRSERVESGYE
jgi:hypothetical protein